MPAHPRRAKFGRGNHGPGCAGVSSMTMASSICASARRRGSRQEALPQPRDDRIRGVLGCGTVIYAFGEDTDLVTVPSAFSAGREVFGSGERLCSTRRATTKPRICCACST